MKSLLIASTLAIAALTSAPAAHAGNVGVSISVGQPGFYGQLNIGGFPPPAVVYTEPVMVQQVYAPPPPVYLRVPPAHYQHWASHCAYYGACGRPVYFVQEGWYARTYAPAYGYGRPHGYPVVAPPPPPRWDGRRDWDRREWDRRDWDRRDGDRRDWDRRGGDGRGDGRGGDGRGWDGRRDGDGRRGDDRHHRDH